jgi:hypothetical protein
MLTHHVSIDTSEIVALNVLLDETLAAIQKNVDAMVSDF